MIIDTVTIINLEPSLQPPTILVAPNDGHSQLAINDGRSQARREIPQVEGRDLDVNSVPITAIAITLAIVFGILVIACSFGTVFLVLFWTVVS
jgi:hypothetical protein